MKELKNILAAWGTGAVLAAFVVIILGSVLEFTQGQLNIELRELTIGIGFWVIGIFIAMFPTVLVMSIVFKKKKEFRGRIPMIVCGIVGLLNMWAYAALSGEPNPTEDWINSSLLGIGAIVASMTFWKANEWIEPGESGNGIRRATS